MSLQNNSLIGHNSRRRAASGVGGLPISWDETNKHSSYWSVTNGGKTVSKTTGELTWNGIATDAVITGKAYIELNIDSAQALQGTNTIFGFIDSSFNFIGAFAIVPNNSGANICRVYHTTGEQKYQSSVAASFTDNVNSGQIDWNYVDDATMMFACDAVAGDVWFGLDGSWLQGGDPAAGTTPWASDDPVNGSYMFFMTSYHQPGDIAVFSINETQVYAPPSGFTPYV